MLACVAGKRSYTHAHDEHGGRPAYDPAQACIGQLVDERSPALTHSISHAPHTTALMHCAAGEGPGQRRGLRHARLAPLLTQSSSHISSSGLSECAGDDRLRAQAPGPHRSALPAMHGGKELPMGAAHAYVEPRASRLCMASHASSAGDPGSASMPDPMRQCSSTPVCHLEGLFQNLVEACRARTRGGARSPSS